MQSAAQRGNASLPLCLIYHTRCPINKHVHRQTLDNSIYTIRWKNKHVSVNVSVMRTRQRPCFKNTLLHNACVHARTHKLQSTQISRRVFPQCRLAHDSKTPNPPPAPQSWETPAARMRDHVSVFIMWDYTRLSLQALPHNIANTCICLRVRLRACIWFPPHVLRWENDLLQNQHECCVLDTLAVTAIHMTRDNSNGKSRWVMQKRGAGLTYRNLERTREREIHSEKRNTCFFTKYFENALNITG